jgi:hypothetical protein
VAKGTDLGAVRAVLPSASLLSSAQWPQRELTYEGALNSAWHEAGTL